MSALETYLWEVAAIRPVAVKETSYYPALSNLFNDIGRGLKPRVRCVIHPSSSGAGLPDGGFFTPDQLRGASDADLITKVPPSRGVIEAKGTGDNADTIAHSPQVARYLERYGQVLVTTLRDFVLVGKDAGGKAAILERYSLAPNEATFWNAAMHAHETAEAQGERFTEYVKRVMLHAAPLTRPQDVAWFLASYARDARARLTGTDLPALAGIRTAMEEGLGLRFEGAKGDHFFLSTFLQTLFYGIFSAWVLWHNEQPTRTESFRWRDAELYLRVPVIAALFEQLSMHSRLRSLGLLDVLDWTAATLNRVDRAAFFDHFEEEHAVQYFYEPFLEAFDPELRRELGVWYTPPEIVRYMVARVDTVLREELGIADGFADERVIVLDPCCGTGAYLTEVIRQIAATLDTRSGDALAAHDLKQAAMTRVFGFEVLPAPYVVAHLQLGLLLHRLGAPLADQENERVGVYLTNALTGWQASDATKQPLVGFPELAEERDAAEGVKQKTPILVILGNPPYNGLAGVAMAEERDLSVAYRKAKTTRQPQGQGLNDLYVRFFRMAERRIVEGTGAGVVCFISNYSWLDGLSFTAMRERYLDVFDHIWIDNLHGDRIISEYAPSGETSETVFATRGSSPGIKIGTAIALLAKNGNGDRCVVRYRDIDQARAVDRRAALLESLTAIDFDQQYQPIVPINDLGLPFNARAVGESYLSWSLLPNLFPISYPGVKTSRDDVLTDIDRDRLVRRMEAYFDPSVSHDAMRQIAPGFMDDSGRFSAEVTRDHLRKRGFLCDNIVRYCYRPFDVRWLYWEPETKLLDEKRSEYFPQVFAENVWIEARQRQPMEHFDRGFFVRVLADNFGNGLSNFFPLYLRPTAQTSLFDAAESGEPKDNLSDASRAYLAGVGGTADNLFYHTLAVLHAPTYREENAGALRQDWPRVPLPGSRDTLLASAALGRRIAALLDTETDVPGVTKGNVRADLRLIGPIHHIEGRQLRPEAGELDVTAGWGHGGKGGVTMPGRGKTTEREYTPLELAAFAEGATALGMTLDDALACLGETTRDVYLNGVAYWANIPAKVWEYTIGGYQVMKKWLSYRERALLGRSLTVDEVREVTQMARRIAAILLLTPALDANYLAVT